MRSVRGQLLAQIFLREPENRKMAEKRHPDDVDEASRCSAADESKRQKTDSAAKSEPFSKRDRQVT